MRLLARAGGQCGERRTSECPARDVMGMRVLELGKRVRWTWGVQAPAAWVVFELVFFVWSQGMCLGRRDRLFGSGKGNDGLEKITILTRTSRVQGKVVSSWVIVLRMVMSEGVPDGE